MEDKLGSEHRRNLLSHNLAALMVIMKSLDEPGHVGLIVDADDLVGREMIGSLVGPEVIDKHRARTAADASPTVLTHLPEAVVKRWLQDNGYRKTLSEWQETGLLKVLIIGAGGITLAQVPGGR